MTYLVADVLSELINVFIIFDFLNCVEVFQVKTLIAFFFWKLKDKECKADKKAKIMEEWIVLYACIYILQWTES